MKLSARGVPTTTAAKEHTVHILFINLCIWQKDKGVQNANFGAENDGRKFFGGRNTEIMKGRKPLALRCPVVEKFIGLTVKDGWPLTSSVAGEEVVDGPAIKCDEFKWI